MFLITPAFIGYLNAVVLRGTNINLMLSSFSIRGYDGQLSTITVIFRLEIVVFRSSFRIKLINKFEAIHAFELDRQSSEILALQKHLGLEDFQSTTIIDNLLSRALAHTKTVILSLAYLLHFQAIPLN